MKEYLKMADVFDGIAKPRLIDDEAITEMVRGDASGSLYAIEDGGCWLAAEIQHIEYAAHAINSHDELVKKLQTAESTLDEVELVLSEAQKNGNYDFDDLLADVIYAIKRIEEVEQ